MQPWALAYRDELVARLGAAIGDDDLDRADAALDDVSAIVLEVAGDPDWTAETVPRAVRTVVLTAARRRFTNPDDLLMETETVGSVTTMEQRAAGTGGVYLTVAEAAIVRRHRPGSSGGLFVQRTTRGAASDSTLYLPDSFGTPMPLDTRGAYGQ